MNLERKNLYFSKTEFNDFVSMRELNKISFFRIRICKNVECKNEVMKDVMYCSKKCFLESEGEE